MKTLVAAIALTIAFPVAANAKAAQQHQNHAEHKGMDHSQHKSGSGKDCCDMKCCEKAKREGKKMECCDKAEAPHSGMKH